MSGKKKRRSDDSDKVKIDAIGIILLGCAAISFVAIFAPHSLGPVGTILSGVFVYSLGSGRFLVPLALIGAAIVLFIRANIKIGSEGLGGLLLILSSLAFMSVQPLDQFDLSVGQLGWRGGLLGHAVAYVMVMFVGQLGAYILLFSTGLVGMVLIVNRPVVELIQMARPAPRREQMRVGDAARPIGFAEDTIILDRQHEHTEPVAVVDARTVIDEEEGAGAEEDIEIVPRAPAGPYRLPSLSLLKRSKGAMTRSARELRGVLERTLREFNVPAKIVGVQEGPTRSRHQGEQPPPASG